MTAPRCPACDGTNLHRQFQTKFGDGEGNCFMACVASILGVPLAQCVEINHVCHEPDWFDQTDAFLARFGRCLSRSYVAPVGWAIASGDQGPGTTRHSVVVVNGKLKHDPNPGGTGLARTDSYFSLLWRAEAREATPGASGGEQPADGAGSREYWEDALDAAERAEEWGQDQAGVATCAHERRTSVTDWKGTTAAQREIEEAAWLLLRRRDAAQSKVWRDRYSAWRARNGGR